MADRKKKTQLSDSEPLKPANRPDGEGKPVDDIGGVHILGSKDLERHFGTESDAEDKTTGRGHAAKHKNAESGGRD